MATNVTRGNGVLEQLLASKRAAMANRLIPDPARTGRVLDIGCGSHPYFLLNTDFSERYGLDKMVGERAEETAVPKGVTLVHHDIGHSEPLPFDDGYFDVVTMLAVFEHLELPVLRHTLREIHRVLKPGGSYVLTTPAGWTDPILRTMARLGVVSNEEIDEHQDAYTHRRIRALVQEAGFAGEAIRQGSFELFMNLWAVATK